MASTQFDTGFEPVPGYKLSKFLGKGGFGEVWQAEAPGGFSVALKFITVQSKTAAPEIRALELLRSVRHPNLLDVQFAVESNGFLIIASPLCDESLYDRLRKCRDKGMPGIPAAELLEYMVESAKAIDFLNEPRHVAPDGRLVGIQHRDIKPHNIFLVGGSARVADFGLAKVLEGNSASHTGSMTPTYAPPESLRGASSRQSDQYSLAITYYELRCSLLPFTGNVQEVLFAHLSGEPNLEGIPKKEQAVIAKALAKQPEDRFPSCQHMVQKLREAALGETGGRIISYAVEGNEATAPADVDMMQLIMKDGSTETAKRGSTVGLTQDPDGSETADRGFGIYVLFALCMVVLFGVWYMFNNVVMKQPDFIDQVQTAVIEQTQDNKTKKDEKKDSDKSGNTKTESIGDGKNAATSAVVTPPAPKPSERFLEGDTIMIAVERAPVMLNNTKLGVVTKSSVFEVLAVNEAGWLFIEVDKSTHKRGWIEAGNVIRAPRTLRRPTVKTRPRED